MFKQLHPSQPFFSIWRWQYMNYSNSNHMWCMCSSFTPHHLIAPPNKNRKIAPLPLFKTQETKVAAKRKVSTSQKKLLGNKRAELNRPVCKWLKAQGQLLGWDASSESLVLIMGIFTNLSTGDVAGFLNHPPVSQIQLAQRVAMCCQERPKKVQGSFFASGTRPQWSRYRTCMTQCGGDDSKFIKDCQIVVMFMRLGGSHQVWDTPIYPRCMHPRP